MIPPRTLREPSEMRHVPGFQHNPRTFRLACPGGKTDRTAQAWGIFYPTAANRSRQTTQILAMDDRAKLLATLATLVRSGKAEVELSEMVLQGYDPTALHNLVVALECAVADDGIFGRWGFSEIAAFTPAAPAGAARHEDVLEPAPELQVDASTKCLHLVLGERAVGEHKLLGYGYLFGRPTVARSDAGQGRELYKLRDPLGGQLRLLALRAGDPASEELARGLTTLCYYMFDECHKSVIAPLRCDMHPAFP